MPLSGAPLYRTLWMGGAVHIDATHPFDETARLLSHALAVAFVKDVEGKYEEFPAFTARAAGLEFVLLGIPLPEYDLRDHADNTYELQVHSDGSVFPADSVEADRFHAVELSEFYARFIQSATGIACSAQEYPGAA